MRTRGTGAGSSACSTGPAGRRTRGSAPECRPGIPPGLEGERADRGQSCLPWLCSLPCHSALPAGLPPTDPSPPHGAPGFAVSFPSTARARHSSLIATVGTLLPPLLLAGPPCGASKGDSVRRDENARINSKERYPRNLMPGGTEAAGLGNPQQLSAKGAAVQVPRGGGCGPPLALGLPTHQSCSGSHSSSTGAPNSRAG